jgi:type IV secretion system protein VirD4
MTLVRDGTLLLGWRSEATRRMPVGFAQAATAAGMIGAPVYADADSHLLTVAPTGAGKGRGLIVPALLSYPGSVLCIDPKGENAAVTARYRRALGQDVHILDPFGVTGQPCARLDPLDCLQLPRVQLESEAEMLCEMVFPAEKNPRNLFWDNLARDLVSGLIVNAATTALPGRKGLAGVFRYLARDDFDYELAVALDTGTVKHSYAHRAFAQYLSLGNGNSNNHVRPDTLATARSHLGFLASQGVQAAVTDSSVDLGSVLGTRPVTIYLVMPPEYLESHSRLLRIWIGALTRALLMRRSAHPLPFLLLLDEMAQLGPMPMLRQAITLTRGYGVRVWGFWQNLAQLRHCYGDWETIIDNSATFQAFGCTNFRMARELADLIGIADAHSLMRLPRDHLVMSDRSGEAMTLRRPDYLHDALFAGRFDPNPLHQPSPDGAVSDAQLDLPFALRRSGARR